MRNGFKVFDADAHVNYPPDLWSRFLDKEFRDRIGRRQRLVSHRPSERDAG